MIDTAPKTRRRMLLAIAAVALAASTALAGCGQAGPSQGGGTATLPDRASPELTSPDVSSPDQRVAPGTVVMIIRHGEKPEGDNSLPGIDENGNPDDSSMTQVGWQRAHRLADLFDPAQGEPKAGLARPKTIYAAGATADGEGARTRETVKPLADRLGVKTITTFGKGEEEELVESVTKAPGPVLISWQHSQIPDIAEAFGAVSPAPPAEWPSERYDVVWTLTATGNGSWQFNQIPELVLPGDQPTVISE